MKYSLQLMLLTVAMMLFGFSARAGSINEEQAKAKALSFLQKQHPSPSGKRLAFGRMPVKLQRMRTGLSALYVFNVGEQDGFIIVAGDDRARSILGYADTGSFDDDHTPAALRELLTIYVRQIDMLGKMEAKSDSVVQIAQARRRISSTMADVAPLLTTSWNQFGPYNDYCPTQNDQTALTGCVATAMAQIANYYKYPTSQVPSLAAYTSATNKINVSAWGATTFDWDNMLDSYNGSETNAQKKAVATLMRYCGQAAQMDYGFTSGAYNGDALYAFKEKLGYQSNAVFKSAASYSTNGWEDLIYKEVREGRPVYYSALNESSLNAVEGSTVSGHAFVIDGYQADGNYFHVNWGWGGACDGYFNLFALDPNAPQSAATSTGWHYQMLALIGLSPQEVNTAKLMKDASGSWLITSTDDWNELSANLEAYNGGSFKLTSDINVTTMVGSQDQPFSGTFDGQGHTLNLNIVTDLERTGPFHWARNSTFKNIAIDGTLTTVNHGAGGLIGWAQNVIIQNCTSNVTITSSYSGDGTCAGFICLVRDGGPAYFYDCVFTGSIHGPNIAWCSGLCGWQDDGAYFSNCLNLGTYDIASNEDCATFCRNGAEVNNCYYITSVADYDRYRQGTSVTAEQLADGSLARRLQDGSRDWTTGLVWGQQLGTDKIPVLTNDTSKGVYQVSFVVDGQVLKTVFTNGSLGSKMPAGEDFGLANATFTSNGASFTSTTPITSDLTVTVTGTSAYTLTLSTPANGTISINNNSCIPGTLKKVTTTPANGYKLNTVTVTDANGKALPVTQVSNNANEFVFAFPKSSVTVTAEFIAGEAEGTRFINGGITLPTGDQPWTADTWTIWRDEYGGDRPYVGTPPVDALGHQWYEEGYALTNSDADVLPNGNKVVWENHSAFFGEGGSYEYLTANGGWDDRACNFYFRRIFTFNNKTMPSKLYLWFRYDDGPASFYLNGTLIYENSSRACIDTAIELTPEQMALIHTDGTPNVLAAWCTQISGPYYIDCGLYDPTVFSYEVTSENTVRVLRNTFITGDVVIPEKVTSNGVTYTVTELADDVFNEIYYGMTSVCLPPTLTNVGNNTFWGGCDQNQYIKSYVPIYQPQTMRLLAAPADATEFELPIEYTGIWNYAFGFTEKLTKLTLQRSLTWIGENVFGGCKALTDIYAYSIPVPQTEGNAFEGLNKSAVTVHVYASALNSYKQSWGEEFKYVTMSDPLQITLTVNVTDAGSLRTLIEAAVIDKGSTIYDVVGITVTGNINQDDLRTLSTMCTGVYSLSTIDLGGAIIEGNYIDSWMFCDKEKLTSIILPETLEYIYERAFSNCDGLTAIDIPATVKRISNNAFSDCNNLATVTGMEGLSEIDLYGDWDPFIGTAITQPVYGGSVFLYMPPSITGEYEMPAGIKLTAPGSIRNSGLSAITLPASLTNLGDDTFMDCPNLTDIFCYATTPPACASGVWEFGFDRSACTVHVPASAVEDYKNAGEWNEMGRIVGIVSGELVDITIQVTTAGTLNDELFNAAVANANISDKLLIRNLTVTGSLSADDIAYLNTLPNTLYNMEMLDLSGTTLAGNAIAERMFYGTLYKCIKLPSGVKSIAEEAFRDSRRMREVILPETLETIGAYAFAGSGLNSITIPDGVTEMGHRSLQSCYSLTSITIGNGVTEIPECFAEGCNNLDEVTIGEKVASIRWRAFPGFHLKQVNSYAKNPPSWDDAFYDGINADAVLHVYSNNVKRYKNANGWNQFPTIVGDLGTYTTYDITVNVTEAGTFSNALQTAMTAAGCEDMMDINKLTVTGNINNDDLYYLRENLGAALEMLDLSAVTLDGNSIDDYVLAGCGFDEVKLPASLTCIRSHAFENTGLTSITIPDAVTEMGDRVFQSCGLLTSITLGNGITTIPECWAEFSENLEKLTIGKRVSSIGWRAFCGTNIKHVYCYAKNPTSWNDCFYGDINSDAVLHVYSNSVNRYRNANGWKNFPNIVGDLGTYTSFDIAVNVETMGTFNEALATAMSKAGCEDMTDINKLTVTGNINTWDLEYIRFNMGASLVSLDLGAVTMEDNYTGDNALACCGFEELILPDNLVFLGGWNPLSNCSNLKSLHIPSSVRTIGAGLLNGATSLETVTGGDGVIEMDRGSSYFSGCTKLKSTVIFNKFLLHVPVSTEGTYEVPENVTVVARDVFAGCSKLTEVKLPASLEFIGSYAFANTGLTSITLPKSVTEIGDRAFQSCSSLTSITLGNDLAHIPECLAETCDRLEELTIGKGVASVGRYAFRGSNLKNVYFHAKCPPSWDDSFYDGISSNAVLHVYSNCVELYKNAYGWKNFRTIVGDLGVYPSVEIAVNVQIPGTFSAALMAAMSDVGCEDKADISKLTVTGYVNNDDLYYIRDRMGVTLEVLNLGAVTVEGNYMAESQLAGCRFEELVLPSTLESIQGWSTLEGCPNLKTINIPNSVRYIGPGTLNSCSSLETVTGGNGVRDMDAWNGMYFDNCPNLKSPVILGGIMFRLPLGTLGAYEMPDYVTTIARDGMWGVKGLTSLTLPESVNTIYANSFAGNENLKDIYYYAVELPNVDWPFESFNRPGCTLHVYEEMVEVFQNDGNWCDFNIVGDLGTMPIIIPMDEADYADLCTIYNSLGGNNWSSRWLISKNVQTASRWRGVTFDKDGYVESINLDNNMVSGDIGELTFSGLTKLTSLNLNNNALSGDIMAFVAKLPTACKLYVEGQDLGYIGEHTLYEVCGLAQGQDGGLPSIAFYRSDSRSLALTLIGVGGRCNFYHRATTGGDFYGNIFADGGTESWHKFYWPSTTTMECTYPHRFTFTYKYEMGDANMDDVLNVLDLQSTLNYSNGNQWGLFNHNAADTYGQDDDINVQDIVATVNLLLAQDSDSPAATRTSGEAHPTEAEAWVGVENGQIVLYTTKPVAALDLHLSGIEPEQLTWTTETMGFATAMTAKNGGTHAIVYSMMPREIEEGRTVLATFDTNLCPRLISAVLSDGMACSINVGNGKPTGINLLNGDTVSQWILTDLSGLRVAVGTHATEADILKMAKSQQLHGVFILDMDGTKRKIVIK